MVTALVILSGWLLFTGQKKTFSVLKTSPGLLLIASLCLAFNYLGYMQSLHITTPANAQIFIQMGPLILALSGIFLFKETLSKLQAVGLIACVIGFTFFFIDMQASFADRQEQFLLGFLWIFAAALTWSLFAILQKFLLKKWTGNHINLYVFVVSTLVFVGFVDWNALFQAPLKAHLVFLFLGFNTMLAYGGLSIALKYLPATQVSPIISLNPLFTLLFLFLLETTTWSPIPPDPIQSLGYVGAFLAVLGVILVVSQRKVSKRV